VGFQDFVGNTATVTHLRESVRSGRFPHSLILGGPAVAGFPNSEHFKTAQPRSRMPRTR
jgi:DNA polymerase III gamma/tau subunit